MKNILLALLLANILYWLWGAFQEEEPEPGVVIVSESDLGPPLDVTVGIMMRRSPAWALFWVPASRRHSKRWSVDRVLR